MATPVNPPSFTPPPPGLFSHGLIAGDTIYVSGQHAGGDDGAPLGDGSMLDQTTRALQKIQAVLEAAGAGMRDVVKLTIYVTDMSRRADVTAARRAFFGGDAPPCSTLLEVNGFIHPDLCVEIDAVAVKNAPA